MVSKQIIRKGVLFFVVFFLAMPLCVFSQSANDTLDLFRKSEEFRKQERLPEEKRVEVDSLGRITVNFYKVDLQDALSLLEEKTGKAIAISDGVRGEVTVKVSGVTFEEALSAVLSGTGYIFREVEGVYLIETEPPPPTEMGPPLEEIPLEQRPITNVFVDTDIRQVLYTVAAQAGTNILVDDTVRGYVSIDLQNVPLEKALEMILAPGGYTFARMDGYYLVGSPDPRNPTFPKLSNTESVQLKYLDAEVASKLLSDFFDPYVKVDNKRNVLLISGSPEIIRRVKADIAKIDVPRKQIMVEALITEVKKEGGKEFGIDWGWSWLPSEIEKASQVQGVEVTGLEVGYTSKVVGEIFASLRALVTEGKAEIKATPKVSTLDGEEASISVDREEYYIILVGPPEAPYRRFETITVGISMSILPRITGEDEIMMRISPQVSDVIQREETEFPVVSRRTVETVVRVKDGQTVIIGGLLQDIKRQLSVGVPFLRKIPLLDLLFERKSDSQQETELVVFITPHIVQ